MSDIQTSQNSGPCFPTEIFDLIIKRIAKLPGRPPTYDGIDEISKPPLNILRNLSLVCKAFVPLARLHIFSQVQFGPYGYLDRNRWRLAQVVIRNPSISVFIKDVVYAIDTREWESFPPRDPNAGNDLPASNKHSATLHELLPEVQSLRIIHHISGHGSRCRTDSCIKICHTALREFSSSPTHAITSLHIRGVSFDIRSVLSIWSLQSLSTKSCQWLGPWNDDHGTDTATSPLQSIDLPSRLPLQHLSSERDKYFPYKLLACLRDLERISVTSCSQYSEQDPKEWFTDQSKFPCFNTSRALSYDNLRVIELDKTPILIWLSSRIRTTPKLALPALMDLRLDFGARSSSDGSYQAFYDVLAQSSKVFGLCLSTSYAREWDPQNPSLQLEVCFERCKRTLGAINIRFVNLQSEDRRYDASRIHNLCDALSLVSGSNCIEELEIDLDECLEYSARPGWRSATAPAWTRLDDLFHSGQGKVAFPSFRVLILSINRMSNPYEEREEWEPGFWTECFSRMHADFEVRYDANYFQSRYRLARPKGAHNP